MTVVKLWPLIILLLNMVRCQGSLEGYIAGGEYTDIKKFPHSVSIKAYCDPVPTKLWKCGATLLSKRLLLTAGHCVSSCQKDVHNVVALAGSNNNVEPLQKKRVTEFEIHKKFNKKLLIYDIALLLVDSDFKLGKTIRKAGIMTTFTSGIEAFIAGWGVTGSEGNETNVKLKFVKQKVWKEKNCRKISNPKTGVFCASSCSRKDYPLDGDSGSSLVVLDPAGKAKILGLISYRINYKPFVTFYTNVSHYRKWVKKHSKLLLNSTTTLNSTTLSPLIY